MPPSLTPPVIDVSCTYEARDGDEDLPIDGDGSDEDDEAYEPSPKKARIDAAETVTSNIEETSSAISVSTSFDG